MKDELPVVEPIIPVLSKTVPVGRAWRYELKLDGFRGTLYIDGKHAWFRSTMRVMKRFDPLAMMIAKQLAVRNAILDGEIIVIRKRAPDFCALMFRRGQPEYAAFDLLFLNGRDLQSLPYAQRKQRLQHLLAKQTLIGYVESHTSPALFTAAARLDLEGIVEELVRSVRAPTLVVIGDRDIVRPEHALELTRLIPDARLLILPGGHGDYLGEAVMTTQDTRMPEVTAALIEEFLGGS